MGFFGLTLLYIQPIYFNIPIYYDSGIFAYVGSVINYGGLPNLDAFDHKGIWIYLINSYGLRLFDGEFRGIYLVELILITFSLIFSLFFINKSTQKNLSGLALGFVALVASYAVLFEGGNLPETIMFPWQIIFYSFSAYLLTLPQTKDWQLILLVIFALLAIYVGIFTRPNNAIGTIVLAIILCFNLRRTFFIFLLIFGLILACLIAYMINSLGLSHDMLNQYIQYNLYYANKYSAPDRLKNSASLLLQLSLLPLSVFLAYTLWGAWRYSVGNKFIKYFVSAIKFKYCKANIFLKVIKNIKSGNILYVFSTVTIFDIISQLVSGRFGAGYLHYAIITLPGFFIFSVFLQNYFLRKKNYKLQYHKIYLKQIIIIIVILAISVSYFNRFAHRHLLYKYSEAVNKLVKDIKKNTLVGDSIYVSYADAWIYVVSKHKSFTRYFYPNVVLETDFDGKDRVGEMLYEYKKIPPSILVVWQCIPLTQAFQIKELREKLEVDYTLRINESDYCIYVRAKK
jgi:hypothetical protein